jgi:hypothetical protein
MKTCARKLMLRLIPVCIIAVLLAICLILDMASASIIKSQTEQFAATRWMADDSIINYEQLTCFMKKDQGFTENDILYLRQAYDEKMVAESITAPENARLWIHAYSGTGKINVDAKTDIETDVTAVGGDFFIFHDIALETGSYFSDKSLNKNHVLISDDLAFRLFGSNDVIGMDIYISEIPYTVSGVTKADDSSVSDVRPHIYIPYDIYATLDNSCYISCYEVILPNPISGYARTIVESLISTNAGNCEIVTNTSRYSFRNLWNTIGELKSRSVRESGISYTSWENEARIVEDTAAVMLLIRIILLAVCLIITVILLVFYKNAITENLEKISDYINNKIMNSRIVKNAKEKRRLVYEKNKNSQKY